MSSDAIFTDLIDKESTLNEVGEEEMISIYELEILRNLYKLLRPGDTSFLEHNVIGIFPDTLLCI